VADGIDHLPVYNGSRTIVVHGPDESIAHRSRSQCRRGCRRPPRPRTNSACSDSDSAGGRLVTVVISRRRLLVGGAGGLAAATGICALLRKPSGPVINPLPVGADPDGYLVAAYQANSVSWRVLDPRTGNYVARDGSYAASSPDLRYTLAYEAAQLSRSTRVLDTGSGAVVHEFGHAWNLPLGWSRDGRHIVVGSANFHDVNSKEDNYFTVDRVGIFDVATGAGHTVAHWESMPTLGLTPWWTTDGRLVCTGTG
jgi:hypothetical protein